MSRPSLRLAVASLLVLSASLLRAQVPDAPLGSTPAADGTTFRVWAPFVQSASVVIENGATTPLVKETGHADDDLIWSAKIPTVKADDHYRFETEVNQAKKQFNDPRARQLTASDDTAWSVVTAPPAMPPHFDPPAPRELVIYELHIGTFNHDGGDEGTFASTSKKLDYLQNTLGVNAIELMPVHENSADSGRTPHEYDWGYDPMELSAVEHSYGTPDELTDLVKQCHAHHMAVILDVVYNHLVNGNLLQRADGFTDASIPNGIYFYDDAARLNADGFGVRPNFGRPRVQDLIRDNALMWLDGYGFDGLRWDSTDNIRRFETDHHTHARADIKEGADMMRVANDDSHATSRPSKKISIAEDLNNWNEVVAPTGQDAQALGFDSQWDQRLYYALRHAVAPPLDNARHIQPIADALSKPYRDDNPFTSVVFSENHDKVGHPTNDPDGEDGKHEVRLPALIDDTHPQSLFAKKRSTLAAAVVLTAPGIPMLFQGQEMLDPRAFDFGTHTDIEWNRVTDANTKGIVQMYHDLIALRRNVSGTTAGLLGTHINVFHIDEGDKTLAYHRFDQGGAKDDVVVVVNLSSNRRDNLNIGFPLGGTWHVRLNSGAAVYDSAFVDGDSADVIANPGHKDGLNFKADVGVGPYSVVIFSQD